MFLKSLLTWFRLWNVSLDSKWDNEQYWENWAKNYNYIFSLKADPHFGTLCFNLAWYSLHPNSLSFSTQFTPWHRLLLSTFYSSAHFAPHHTLLLSTPCSLEHFTPWNTLLHGTLNFLEHFAFKWSRVQSQYGAMNSRELSVPRSRVFQKAKCAEKQSVLGSKMFQGAECSI